MGDLTPPLRFACLLCCVAAAATATEPAFLARRDYPPISGGIAVADVTGDGKLDLIDLVGQEAYVLLGNGRGALGQSTTSNIGFFANIFSPVTTDLNGDGEIDLVASGEQNINGPFGIAVSFGNGDGTFQTAAFYPAGSDNSTGNIVLADFNGDGIPDVAVAASSGVWLFTGMGGGLFSQGVLTPVTGTAEDYRNQIAVADFNQDGKLDVAVATSTGFSTLLGNGDGTFQPPQAYASPSGIYGWYIAAAALGPGRPPDVILSYQANLDEGAASTLAVYRNDGSGALATPVKADLPTYGSFTVGDVNGDGIPDLVSGAGYVALGNGNGTFQPPTYYPLPSGFTSSAVVLADLRNDGRNDLVFEDSDSEISVLLNFGKGRFEDGEWIPTGAAAGCGAAADYNGDGKPDLAVNTLDGVSVLLGTGQPFPVFTAGAIIPLADAGCLITGDLNNDGIPDLLVPIEGAVVALLGNGDGTFTKGGVTPTSTGGYLALGDFNHDGNLDFATSGNLIAYGNGDGTFRSPVPIYPGLPDNLTSIIAGDINNDGWPDLIIDDDYEASMYVLLNNHHGGFTEREISVVNPAGHGLAPGQMVLSDLNGDGNLDVVFAELYGTGASIFVGDGKGGFQFKASLDTPIYTFDTNSTIAVSDLNGDGIPDIVLTAASTLSVYLGTGNADFAEPSFYIGAGPFPGSLLTESLHGQAGGFPDIVAPDVTGGVMVLINATKGSQ